MLQTGPAHQWNGSFVRRLSFDSFRPVRDRIDEENVSGLRVLTVDQHSVTFHDLSAPNGDNRAMRIGESKILKKPLRTRLWI
jgi:hypothetical protein